MKEFFKPTFFKLILFILIFISGVIFSNTCFQQLPCYNPRAGFPFNFVKIVPLVIDGKEIKEIAAPRTRTDYLTFSVDIFALYCVTCGAIALIKRFKNSDKNKVVQQ